MNRVCSCPHHYTATGLQRYGTDACCPVHGAPTKPAEESRPVLQAPTRDQPDYREFDPAD